MENSSARDATQRRFQDHLKMLLYGKRLDPVSATKDVARQWFTELVEEALRSCLTDPEPLIPAFVTRVEEIRSKVIVEVGLLWDGTGGWYERYGRPAVEAELARLANQTVSKALRIVVPGFGHSPSKGSDDQPPNATQVTKGAETGKVPDEELQVERAARRQAVVLPILKDKGWTRGRLATEAGVAKNSVYEYLDGTRAWISGANRTAIAETIGLKLDDLPE